MIDTDEGEPVTEFDLRRAAAIKRCFDCRVTPHTLRDLGAALQQIRADEQRPTSQEATR